MSPKALRLADAVTYSGITRTALYHAISLGHVIAKKSGRATLIDRESLDNHIDALPRAIINIASAQPASAK